MIVKIPTTVVSGFSGTGKTTLIRRLTEARAGEQVLRLTSALGDGLLEFGPCESKTSDGSIRCESREHLSMELRKAGRAKQWSWAMVESSSGSDPLPVAEVIALDDGRGAAVSRYVEIDAMITLVDASRFPEDLFSNDLLADRGMAFSESDDRHVAEVIAAQVEFADVLAIVKTDLVDEARIAKIAAIVGAMNPRARILRGTTAELPLSDLMPAKLFHFEKATAALQPGQTTDSEGAGPVIRFGYRRFRPFHPQRFQDLVSGDLSGIVRSKGTYWLAHRPDTASEWSQIGKTFRRATAGAFWAASAEATWPVGEERKAQIKAVWQAPYGDRRQELSFVLDGLSRGAVEARLDAALLTDEELALGPDGWKKLVGGAHDHPHHHHHDHHDHHHHDPAPAPDADPTHVEHEHAVVAPTRFVGHTPAGGHHSN